MRCRCVIQRRRASTYVFKCVCVGLVWWCFTPLYDCEGESPSRFTSTHTHTNIGADGRSLGDGRGTRLEVLLLRARCYCVAYMWYIIWLRCFILNARSDYRADGWNELECLHIHLVPTLADTLICTVQIRRRATYSPIYAIRSAQWAKSDTLARGTRVECCVR